jgi:hypothetical protein
VNKPLVTGKCVVIARCLASLKAIGGATFDGQAPNGSEFRCYVWDSAVAGVVVEQARGAGAVLQVSGLWQVRRYIDAEGVVQRYPTLTITAATVLKPATVADRMEYAGRL